MKSRLFKTLAFIAVIAMVASTVSAQSKLDVSKLTEKSVYIVVFEEPAVPAYRGGVAGLRATNPGMLGETKLDVSSADSKAYQAYLANQQAQFITSVEASFGRKLDVQFQYQLALNGMAVELTTVEATSIAKMAGVKAVVPEWEDHAMTDSGPAWIGAPAIWDGTATGVATMGEGIVIGVLDTGINADHPSFAQVGPVDGYVHTNPRGQYYGWCNPSDPNYDATLVCNDKLIGQWSGDADGPEDAHSHGSHVASIAAGNELEAGLHVPTAVLTRTISGVAPHANIIAYNIEGVPGTGNAPGAIILAATEQAIADQVDVVNYSFGGDPDNPWLSAMHWLNVRDAGIFAITSAGNDGPGAGTAGSPGNAPWLLSVASSTHDRVIENALVDMTGGASPPADIVGKGLTAGYGPAEIVYAGWYTTTPSGTLELDTARLCLVPFPPGTFDGEIVVCDRGINARVDKGANVLTGGAGGYVLANDAANDAALVADAHFLPAVHITYQDGLTLKSWLTNTLVQTATITGYTFNITDTNGNQMSSFSSRGPNFNSDILKPNVSAPGQDIWGAANTNAADPAPYPEYRIGSGTSQASPHVAGAAVLLKALNPTWTPAQLETALMSTADPTGGLKEDGMTPVDAFDVGAGFVDVSMAAKAGLVLDETTANFLAANPVLGGDPTTLNLASFADGHCINTCTWERTVSSSLAMTETWLATVTNPTSVTLTVEPMTFTLAPGGSQVIQVTADVSDLPLDEWVFGEVLYEPAMDASVSSARFPVAVQQVFANVPSQVDVAANFPTGSFTVSGLEGPEITELAINEYGLVQATMTLEYVNQDPTNGSIMDNMCDPRYGTFCVTEVVSDAKRFVAEVIATTSPDLDMFVLVDVDGDGTTEGAICVSASPATLEYCSVADPLNGTYYTVIQNWRGSAPSQPGTGSLELFDEVLLATAVVPNADVGNMTVTGPATVPNGDPFDLDLAWDLSGQTALTDSYWYGAFDLGTSPGREVAADGDIGFVSVNLDYTQPYQIYMPIIAR